ncbi:MAG TPA: DUF1844 domain-containing protein [bacterium]|nr:DUF1844 domain-containing protein [bacterium]
MDKITGEDNIDLINLVLMLNQNALVSLGEAPRFISGAKNMNLPHARQSINMIKAIQEKTKNNLTPGETKLIFRILGELQGKYVRAAGLDKSAPPVNPPQKKSTPMDKALDKLSNDQLASLLSELAQKQNDKDK